MQGVLQLLTVLLPLLYGLSAANYVVYFSRPDRAAERLSTPFLLGCVGVHVVSLLLRALHYGRQPILGIAEVLSVIALAVAVVYLYVERVQRNRFTGAFILPMVVTLALGSSALMPQGPAKVPELLATPLFGVHAVFAVLGYTAFAVSAVYGVMHLMLYRALKQQRFGLVFERLPSLEVLANMGFWASFMGLVALTLTIFIGIGMSVKLVPGFYADPKFVTTIFVWAIYGFGVFARFVWGWTGTRAVYLSLTGFALAMSAMVGSTYIWKSFHQFQA